jgi:hypothetical protein
LLSTAHLVVGLGSVRVDEGLLGVPAPTKDEALPGDAVDELAVVELAA